MYAIHECMHAITEREKSINEQLEQWEGVSFPIHYPLSERREQKKNGALLWKLRLFSRLFSFLALFSVRFICISPSFHPSFTQLPSTSSLILLIPFTHSQQCHVSNSRNPTSTRSYCRSRSGRSPPRRPFREMQHPI